MPGLLRILANGTSKLVPVKTAASCRTAKVGRQPYACYLFLLGEILNETVSRSILP
jgi:hypothetical protein